MQGHFLVGVWCKEVGWRMPHMDFLQLPRNSTFVKAPLPDTLSPPTIPQAKKGALSLSSLARGIPGPLYMRNRGRHVLQGHPMAVVA